MHALTTGLTGMMNDSQVLETWNLGFQSSADSCPDLKQVFVQLSGVNVQEDECKYLLM